jgi:glycosyltransferase involved in cell wall biosynthesis
VTTVHVVVPDDAAVRPSGGSCYDERICSGLTADGWDVRTHAVPGRWPRPDAGAHGALAVALAEVADGGLVLVDGLIATAADAVLVPESSRLKLVVLVHMPVPDDGGRDAEGAVLAAARRVVTTSAWTRAVLLDRHPLDGDRVQVAHPGVDPGPPAPGTRAGNRLLDVAAVVPHKGQDLLIQALAGLSGSWECDLVGPLDRDPGFVTQLRRQIGEQNLGDRVHLRGPEVGGALHRRYAAADLLVHPSRLEAYGMVVAEALARGIPVVAANVGGVPEALGRTIEGVPGLLVPPGDVPALRRALHVWSTDDDLRRRLRRRALARRGTLESWDATSTRIATMLATVAAEPDAMPSRVAP